MEEKRSKLEHLKLSFLPKKILKCYLNASFGKLMGLSFWLLKGIEYEVYFALEFLLKLWNKVVLFKNFASFLSQVFDAYAQFEELSLSKRMEQMQEEGEGEEMAQTEKDELILDLLMARFEDLMERRPLLLNSVLLRQNPHNVAEWQKRVTLLEDKPHEVNILKSYYDNSI